MDRGPFRVMTAALALAGATPVPAADPPPATTVLRAARLFDGRGEAALGNGVVVVKGGRP